MWFKCQNCSREFKAYRITAKYCAPKCRTSYYRKKKRNDENETRAAIGLPPVGHDKSIKVRKRVIEQEIAFFESRGLYDQSSGIRHLMKVLDEQLDEDYIRRDTKRRREWNSRRKRDKR